MATPEHPNPFTTLPQPPATVNVTPSPTSLSPPTATVPSSSSFPHFPIPPHQFSALVPTQLFHGNYLLWKNLITPLLQNFDLFSLIDGSEPTPPSTLPDNQPNPAYSAWIYRDRTCKIFISATLSPDALSFTVGPSTSKALWDVLEKRFPASTRSHILKLKNELHNIKKGTLKMADYLEKFKSVSDALAAAGAPIDDLDLVAHTLRGLPSEYDSFGTSIRVRAEPISPPVLHSLLISEEMEMMHREDTLNPQPPFQAFHTTISKPKHYPKPKSGPSQKRTTFNPPLLPTPLSPSIMPRPQSILPPRRPTFSTRYCKICDTTTHNTSYCKYRNNYAHPGRNAPPFFSAMAASHQCTLPHQSQWYADSGATHHMTNDLQNLSLHSAYPGPDKVYVGNGQGQSYEEGSSSNLY